MASALAKAKAEVRKIVNQQVASWSFVHDLAEATQFGRLVIYIENGRFQRAELVDSIMLKPEDGPPRTS